MEKPVSLFATAASHYEMSNRLFFVLDYVGLLISPCFAVAEALSAISGVLRTFNHRSHRHRLRRPLRSLLWSLTPPSASAMTVFAQCLR